MNKNQIREISDQFELMPDIKFLALFGNQITRVEKELSTCTKLEYLDVSNNQIELLELESLPKSIQILNIQENPIASQITLEQAKQALPKLIMFNDNPIDNKQAATNQEDLESVTAEKLAQSVTKEEFAKLRPLSASSTTLANTTNYQSSYDKEKFDREYLQIVEQIEQQEDDAEIEDDEEKKHREKNSVVYEQMSLVSKSWQLEHQQQLIQEIESMKELVTQKRLELTNQSRKRRKMVENMKLSRDQMVAELLNNVSSLKSEVDKELA
jgi:Leucine-rich repeat (LRR) protein